MIMAFLLKSTFGIPRWMLALLGVALLLAGAWVWIVRAEEADDRRNQELGAAEERAESLEETVKRVETANEVRESVKPGSRAAYDECLRSARTPANCVGLLPSGEGD